MEREAVLRLRRLLSQENVPKPIRVPAPIAKPAPLVRQSTLDKRAPVVDLVRKGATLVAVAKETGLDVSTVSRWCADAGVESSSRSGRRRARTGTATESV